MVKQYRGRSLRVKLTAYNYGHPHKRSHFLRIQVDFCHFTLLFFPLRTSVQLENTLNRN